MRAGGLRKETGPINSFFVLPPLPPLPESVLGDVEVKLEEVDRFLSSLSLLSSSPSVTIIGTCGHGVEEEEEETRGEDVRAEGGGESSLPSSSMLFLDDLRLPLMPLLILCIVERLLFRFFFLDSSSVGDSRASGRRETSPRVERTEAEEEELEVVFGLELETARELSELCGCSLAVLGRFLDSLSLSFDSLGVETFGSDGCEPDFFLRMSLKPCIRPFDPGVLERFRADDDADAEEESEGVCGAWRRDGSVFWTMVSRVSSSKTTKSSRGVEALLVCSTPFDDGDDDDEEEALCAIETPPESWALMLLSPCLVCFVLCCVCAPLLVALSLCLFPPISLFLSIININTTIVSALSWPT